MDFWWFGAIGRLYNESFGYFWLFSRICSRLASLARSLDGFLRQFFGQLVLVLYGVAYIVGSSWNLVYAWRWLAATRKSIYMKFERRITKQSAFYKNGRPSVLQEIGTFSQFWDFRGFRSSNTDDQSARGVAVRRRSLTLTAPLARHERVSERLTRTNTEK